MNPAGTHLPSACACAAALGRGSPHSRAESLHQRRPRALPAPRGTRSRRGAVEPASRASALATRRAEAAARRAEAAALLPAPGAQRARPGYGGAPLAGEVASGARAPRGGGRGRGAPTRRCRWARGALPRQRACSAPAPGRRPPRPGASQAGLGAARPADGLRRPAARERGSGAMPELRGAGEVGAWLRARLSAGCLKSAGIVYASWLTRARARFFRCGHQNSDPQRWRENYFTVKTVAIQ